MKFLNQVNIPKKFYLGGREIKIEWDDRLVDRQDYVGTANYRDNKIVLQKENNGTHRPKDSTEETYLHELVHWILTMMDENELARNEKFVNTFAVFLHQSIRTAEYV